MTVLTKLYSWYGKRVVWGTIGLVIIIALLGAYFFVFRNGAGVEEVAAEKKSVEVMRAGDLATKSASLRTVGTVRAISEARLETESAGRVTAVNVAIGDSVNAGTVLASIENSRERASLLQAEGAYESTLAQNAQSGIGLSEATVGAENTYRTAFTTADDAIRNLTDELFTNPTTNAPGLRIDGQGKASALNAERVLLESVLASWNTKVQNGMQGDKRVLLDEAERDLIRISAFVSDLSLLVSEQDANTTFTEEALGAYKGRFLGARSRIDGALQSISASRNALLSAEQSVEGTAVGSETDARIKQALGALRQAQSAYEKTLIRTPIRGIVNAMYLKANEYVGMSAPAAVVANNGALEITTSVGEAERALIAVGDTVRIDETYTGSITRIAPAVDPLSGKVEVKVSVDAAIGTPLENGATVSLAIESSTSASVAGPLLVPLRALKITPQGPVAFAVENGTLKQISVTIGAIVGDSVVIEEGLSEDSAIVTDARGLKEGEQVEVVSN